MRKKSSRKGARRSGKRATKEQLMNLAKGQRKLGHTAAAKRLEARAHGMSGGGGSSHASREENPSHKKTKKRGPRKSQKRRASNPSYGKGKRGRKTGRKKNPSGRVHVMDLPPKKRAHTHVTEVRTTTGRTGKRRTHTRSGELVKDKGPRFLDTRTGKRYSAAQIRKTGPGRLSLRGTNPSFSGNNVLALGAGVIFGTWTADLVARSIAVMVSMQETKDGKNITAAGGKSTGYFYGPLAVAALGLKPTQKQILVGGAIGLGVLGAGAAIALKTSWVGFGLFVAGVGVAHVGRAAKDQIERWIAPHVAMKDGDAPSLTAAIYADYNDPVTQGNWQTVIDAALMNPGNVASGGYVAPAAGTQASTTAGLGAARQRQVTPSDMQRGAEALSAALAAQQQAPAPRAAPRPSGSFDQLFGTPGTLACGGGCGGDAPADGPMCSSCAARQNGQNQVPSQAVPQPPAVPSVPNTNPPTGTAPGNAPALPPASQSLLPIETIVPATAWAPTAPAASDVPQIRGLDVPRPGSIASLFGLDGDDRRRGRRADPFGGLFGDA